ncbi:hypothetical protein ACN6KF_003037 [Labrys sp. La1]|uniref:hypothetical protein n=1 Tax=Labrys sp. La1 TaxID=3404917 RepID=UPI003EB8CB99
MADNVVWFGGGTTLDVPADRVVDAAKGLKSVVVVGQNEDGSLYFASSLGELSKTHWLLSLAQNQVMQMVNADG